MGAIALTAASLALAVFFARKRTRVRIGFDLLRAAVSVGAILLMTALVGVSTPSVAAAAAIVAGLGLGVAQGSRLEVSAGEQGLYARRSPLGIALWGVGIVIMQGAGIASRTGTLQIGQTVAWFSACLGIGLMVGRNGPLQNAKKTFAGTGVAALVAILVTPTLIGGTATPALAQNLELSDDDVCSLIVPETSDLLAATGAYDPLPGRDFPSFSHPADPLASIETSIAECRQLGYEVYTGQGEIDYTVYLFASTEDAEAQYTAEVAANETWYAPELQRAQEWFEVYETGLYWIGTGPLEDFRVTGRYWMAAQEGRVVMTTGPFLLYGIVTDNLAFDYGEVRPDRTLEPSPQLVETLITPMADTAHNIEAFLAASEAVGTVPNEDPSSAPVAGEGSTGGFEPDTTTTSPTTTDDETIDPEDAVAQAIGGLIAAAAIGLISWAEAAAEIGQILSGTSNSSILDPKAGADDTLLPEPPPESVKEDPASKRDPPKERTDPCAFQLDRFRKALADWQRIQSEISALENEYALTTTRIENEAQSDFLGAAFDVAMLAVDIQRGGQPPTSSMLRTMVDSWGQNWARSITSQMIQQTATGQPIDASAIGNKAAADATGLPALTEDGNPASGAFGTFLSESITKLLAANRSYDYLKFMDTLAEPGAISDPGVMKLIERSSFESFQERVGPWVGVVSKYLDFWHKNQKWGEGVERRAAMREALLTPLRQRIDELKYDLGNVTIERDGWRRDLAKCREETR